MLKYVFIGLIFLSLVGSALWYVKYTNTKMEGLIAQNATLIVNQTTLKDAINKSNATIDRMAEDSREIKERYEKLETDFNLIRMYNNELPAKFERHDLNSLALAKPELIEKIINSATKDANRCLELLSGSPKNAKELAAKNENEFNSECPWLFD